jgi:membrane-bound metal-dependent hydrolase YbcI (DUF457 family)
MEPLSHFILPLAALLLLGEDLRTAAPLALLGLLPDLDALLLLHRSISHSVAVMGLLFLLLLLYARHYSPDHQRTVTLVFLVTASHPILDLGGLTPILWPIYPYSISVRLALNGVLGEGLGLSPRVDIIQALPDFSKVTSIDYPLFTQEGLLLTVVLLLPILYNLAKRRGG